MFLCVCVCVCVCVCLHACPPHKGLTGIMEHDFTGRNEVWFSEQKQPGAEAGKRFLVWFRIINQDQELLDNDLNLFYFILKTVIHKLHIIFLSFSNQPVKLSLWELMHKLIHIIDFLFLLSSPKQDQKISPCSRSRLSLPGRQLPDWSGSCQIEIRQLPDR